MSHFAFDRRQQGLLAAGAMALPLMLVFAASIGDMPVPGKRSSTDWV